MSLIVRFHFLFSSDAGTNFGLVLNLIFCKTYLLIFKSCIAVELMLTIKLALEVFISNILTDQIGRRKIYSHQFQKKTASEFEIFYCYFF